jgi:hypothetical protein
MEPSDLLHIVAEVFERLQIPYLVTGSVASMFYGEPRFTNDIDIVADIRPEHIRSLIASFPSPEYYISDDMIRDALSTAGQFNIIHPASGLKVDVIVRRNTEFDQSRFARKRRIRPTKDFEADFATPEDVVVKKMEHYKEGGSEKHLRDITGILKISGAEVDRRYIESWASRLGVTDIWEKVLHRLDS